LVGGNAHDVGLSDKEYSGIAPYHHGNFVHHATALVFSRGGHGEHDTENICMEVAHEAAHVYGLDHAMQPGDIMSYSPRHGARSFIDKDAPCGEDKSRACGNGDTTQNSYQLLLKQLGARPHNYRG
jgi:hypothetical protein